MISNFIHTEAADGRQADWLQRGNGNGVGELGEEGALALLNSGVSERGKVDQIKRNI